VQTKRLWDLTRFILTTITLMAGWVLFTWSLSINDLLLGLINASVVALLSYPVFIAEEEAGRRANIPRLWFLGVYLVILVFNMYAASFKVLWNIVRGRINPGVVHYRTRLRSEISRVALCNAITMTPGTITLLLDDDHLIVHWLDARTTHSKYAWRLTAEPFEKLLRRIWI
jgi:multicomponent Na+:H+ antiporter subunit E